MKKSLVWGMLLIACGGAAKNGPPPAETITVAAPVEAPTITARTDPPQWLDASTEDTATSTEVDDAGARGPVRIGAVTVTGGRTAELVQRALLESIGDMTRCHEAAVSRGARPNGAMRVRLVVAGSGQSVSANHVDGSAHRPLVRCVLDAAKRVKFTPAVGANVEVTFPVQFSP